MKNTLVRIFQPAQVKTTEPDPGLPVTAQKPAEHTAPVADCEIPEINTSFMDNLWHDPTFLNRFDASFDKTEMMELQAEWNESPQETAAEDPDLLQMNFPDTPRK